MVRTLPGGETILFLTDKFVSFSIGARRRNENFPWLLALRFCAHKRACKRMGGLRGECDRQS
jgi:hypothetical protein